MSVAVTEKITADTVIDPAGRALVEYMDRKSRRWLVDVGLPAAYADWLETIGERVGGLALPALHQALAFGCLWRRAAHNGLRPVLADSAMRVVAQMPPLCGALPEDVLVQTDLPGYYAEALQGVTKAEKGLTPGRVACDGLHVIGALINHDQPGVEFGVAGEDPDRAFYTRGFCSIDYRGLPPLPVLSVA